MSKKIEIGPNSKAQAEFIASPADEALYAGAAGSGKTFALLMAAVFSNDNYKKAEYQAICFRNSHTQVQKTLLVESRKIYPHLGGVYNENKMVWTFPSGARVYFGYLDKEDDVQQYLGLEVQFEGFDEVVLQTEEQYKFLHTRLRSATGIKKLIRSTSNPWAEWVYKRFFPWLDHTYCLCEADKKAESEGRDKDEKYVAELAKLNCIDKIRHRDSGTILQFGKFTRQVVLGRLKDNTTLMINDPTYEDTLKGADKLNKERYYYNNWRAQPAPGSYFKRSHFKYIDVAPGDMTHIRAWDIAATAGAGDYTVGVLLGMKDGVYYVLDVIRGRMAADEVYDTIYNTAVLDGKKVQISLPRDPGGAGKFVQADFAKMLNGFNFQHRSETGSKEVKATPLARQVQGGNVRIVMPQPGSWSLKDFLDELEAFPEGQHDDQVDAFAGAYNHSIGQIIVPYRGWKTPLRRQF